MNRYTILSCAHYIIKQKTMPKTAVSFLQTAYLFVCHRFFTFSSEFCLVRVSFIFKTFFAVKIALSTRKTDGRNTRVCFI